MPQHTSGRRLNEAPTPARYKTIALSPEIYDKVVVWADYLRGEWGRCTIAQAVDYLVDNAGVPPQKGE